MKIKESQFVCKHGVDQREKICEKCKTERLAAKPPRDWFMIAVGLLSIYVVIVSCCVVPFLIAMEIQRWLLVVAK